MKKVIFTLLTISSLYFTSSAQYCGNSGPSVCTPPTNLTQPGLSPPSDSLAPVIDNIPTTTTIEFKNFNTIAFGGQTLTIQSLKIDTISNLPSGLCWATNKANNTFTNQEAGCIQVTGTTQAPAGQYKLYIIVDANVGVAITTNADAAGLHYYVRVDSNASECIHPVDTLQTQANPFISYAGLACPGSGINEIESSFANMSVVPNPFTNQAVVSFTSVKGGMMTEKLTNILGSEVYKREIEVKVGENSTVIERNSIPAGVYFYTLGSGRSMVTKRVVINE
ncbi:MAG: hypothetical protein JWO06_2762 [Bacteroidota bacterium]|nr:hypothetical protein [Bacteroidota bacterium]